MDSLHSGDETFGGEKSKDSSNSSELPYYWVESKVENKAEREEHDDVDDQSARTEDSTPEMKIAETDTVVSERCGFSNGNYVSMLVAQSIVAIQHQVREEKSRGNDIFLFGMMATAQHKE